MPTLFTLETDGHPPEPVVDERVYDLVLESRPCPASCTLFNAASLEAGASSWTLEDLIVFHKLLGLCVADLAVLEPDGDLFPGGVSVRDQVLEADERLLAVSVRHLSRIDVQRQEETLPLQLVIRSSVES